MHEHGFCLVKNEIDEKIINLNIKNKMEISKMIQMRFNRFSVDQMHPNRDKHEK